MDDPELAKYPGLYARSGRWYVRKRVPVDLIHVANRDQVRLSLDTASKRDAIGRYPVKMAEIAMMFEDFRRQLREAGKVTAALAVGKLEKLTQREIEGLVTEWWNGRAEFRKPLLDEFADPAEAAAEVMWEAEAVANPSPEDGDPAGRLADQLLVKAGIAAYPLRLGTIRTQARFPVVDRSTAQYRYLRELVARGLQVEAALATDHLAWPY